MAVKGVRRLPIWIAIVVPILVIVLACGPGAEPTPTPVPTATKAPAATPTATPTAAPAATATPTRPGPLATPTPTAVAVATPTPTPGKQPKRGGTLNLAVNPVPPSFDAQFLSVSADYFQATTKLYSNLLLNYTEEVAECDVCSEWHLENNSKTIVFTLIKGIKFQTGQELTSADVKYSLRMLMGDVDGIISQRSGVIKEYIESIEAPDKYTVRINLIRPSPFVPKILANAMSAIYKDGTTREGLKTAPAGSGPFLADKIVSGTTWSLVRNPNYFKPGQPYIDRVEITQVIDQVSRTAAFLTGRSDIWVRGGQIPEQFVPAFFKLADEGKVEFQELTGGTQQGGVWMVVSKPPFSNLKLRQAVNLALDRKRLQLVLTGAIPVHPQLIVYTEASPYATRSDAQIWGVLPGWRTGAEKDREIEQAKQLMKDAGYPDGIDIEMDVRPDEPFPTTSQEVQKQLVPIGIRTKIKTVTSALQSERQANQTYAIQHWNFVMTTKDPDEVIGQYWLTGAARNITGYSNPQVDKLFVQMSSELDVAKRKQLLSQIVDIIVLQDAGYAPTTSAYVYGFWWKRIQGVTVGQTMHSSAGLLRSDRLWIEQ
ncbi:MAG: ABC transporter substrate-binding protein [Dehalococcoidia bacterium]|nr:ABC transporter substrate-binding protein [Dehalococcoidia bacterium]